MQILDRIFRIIKSNTTHNSNYNNIFEDEDDELKRIIDELNNDKNSSKERDWNNKSNFSENYKSNNIPNDIIKAYNTIGLSYDASIETIKTVYKKKMKEFHPDRVANLSEDIRKRAESRSKDINEAYDKIRKFKNF